jgi:hypothetical protein
MDKQVNDAIENVGERIICWYCESKFIVDGICDDCGKTQYNYNEEVEDGECCSECENQEVYYLKG